MTFRPIEVHVRYNYKLTPLLRNKVLAPLGPLCFCDQITARRLLHHLLATFSLLIEGNSDKSPVLTKEPCAYRTPPPHLDCLPTYM